MNNNNNVLNRSYVFPVKPTGLLYVLILLPHLLAVAIVFFLIPISLPFRLLIITLIGMSLIYYKRLYIQQKLQKSVIEIRQESNKNWLIKTSQNDEKQVALQRSSFINPYLVILNFKCLQNKNYSSILVKGSLSVDELRRLRVRVKVDRSI